MELSENSRKTEWIPFYQEVTLVALVSWCATMSKLGRLRPQKMAASHSTCAPTGECPRKLDPSERIARFGDILNIERVRHEAADVAVMTGRQPGHNPVCDHWYPTKTCGRRNPTVQSSWDNVTSPDPGGRVSRERTRRLLALKRSGARVDGMANSGELLITVVNLSKPKALTGLNQKGKWPGAGASSSPAVAVEPSAERQSLNHPWYIRGT